VKPYLEDDLKVDICEPLCVCIGSSCLRRKSNDSHS